MLTSYVTAIVGVVLLSVLWLAVQTGWRRAFPEMMRSDPDVLALRKSCHGCPEEETTCALKGKHDGDVCREPVKRVRIDRPVESGLR